MFRKSTFPLLAALALLVAASPAMAEGYHADAYLDERSYGCYGSAWDSDYSYSDGESSGYGRDHQQSAACADQQRDAALFVHGDGEQIARAEAGSGSFQHAGSWESQRGDSGPYGGGHERSASGGASTYATRGASAAALGVEAGAREECDAGSWSQSSDASRSGTESWSARRSDGGGATDGCAQRVDAGGATLGHSERCSQDASAWSEQQGDAGGHRAWSSSSQSDGCARRVDVLGYALVADDGCSAWSWSQSDSYGSASSEQRTCATGAALQGPAAVGAQGRESSGTQCDGVDGCSSHEARELVLTAGSVVVAIPLP